MFSFGLPVKIQQCSASQSFNEEFPKKELNTTSENLRLGHPILPDSFKLSFPLNCVGSESQFG